MKNNGLETSKPLNDGDFNGALKLVNDRLSLDPSDAQALLGRAWIFQQADRIEEALADLQRCQELAKDSEDLALSAEVLFRKGTIAAQKEDWEQALKQFMRAAELVDPWENLSAGICQALCRLDRIDEAVPWRHKVLRARDDAAMRGRNFPQLSNKRPVQFDSAAVERNIVSYSLFGGDPYYHECAITIARTTSVSFPEFTPRFYCDPSLPRSLIRALQAAGAQVKIAKEFDQENPFSATFWRFLAFDDKDVDVVMCRDVDSPILPRERSAIDLWLSSTSPFYCLRDHPVHAEPLLAGMWGGFTGLLPNIQSEAEKFSKADRSKFADQRFLRSWVWPRIRTAVLQIDSYQSLDGSVDFPPLFEKIGRQHVGMSWLRERIFA